jgi:outer membrane protein TolC
MKHILIIFALILGLEVVAQDSSTVLRFEEYVEIVKTHHPMSYKAALQSEKGQATVLKARGGFDPKLSGSVNQKYFDDKTYYSYIHGGLKVPTWFGITLQSGYESNEGEYLNRSSTVPEEGLWYAGASIQLGDGLIFDERRAELKQAKIYRESSQLEGQLMLNELYFEAARAYWDWFKAYHKYEVYVGAVENADIRKRGVVSSAFLGDKPFIDTLEAGIQLQNRQIGLQQSLLDLKNKTALLEVYLWQDGFVPLELDSLTIPEPMEQVNVSLVDPTVYTLRDSMLLNHPKLILYQNKRDMKAVDLKLKKQGLLPDLELKYNAFSQPIGGNPLAQYSINNYNWGASISYPILTRKERGAIRLSKLEVREIELEQQDQIATIRYKIQAALNNWNTSVDQIRLYQSVTEDYERLLEGEQKLFSIGESSLFMINSREKALINAQLKLIEFKRDNKVAKHLLDYNLVNIR